MSSLDVHSREQSMDGKHALVTGGARGIGRAITESFQAAGARVCIVDRDVDEGEATAAELTKRRPECPVTFLHADLEKLDQVKYVAEKFASRHGHVDVLVNNAGIEIDKTFEEFEGADWDRMIAINLRAAFFLVQAMVPLFSASGGSIVNLSSIQATHAFPDCVAYACSKAGLLALTRNLALELAPRHIRVNSICPGYIDTRLWFDYLKTVPDADALAAHTVTLHPLGRRGVPEDVSSVALFLATEASAFMTGTHLVVDGGLTVRAHP